MTGQVAQIWRHPIKSHGRESLEHVDLTENKTMPWDRTWAVAHEMSKADGTKWEPCANFSIGSKAPALQAIRAKHDPATGTVTLTHPDLPALTFHPDKDQDAFLAWVAPIMPTDRAKSARIIRVPDRGMTDTDYPSVSLCNLASNRAIGQRLGQEISPLRWRGNIMLDGFDAWAEFDWIGRTIQIGTSKLEVKERIVRCNATKSNPDTGTRDADTLGALLSGWGHTDFGVYAVVTKSGTIAVGDQAAVLS